MVARMHVADFKRPFTSENESRTILDAFFLGKALAETLNERIESSVGEFLSTVGRLQAEQQKQIQEFQKEIQECTPESQNTTNIVDDAISLVFGKEARGRVRGMGFGVTPSKVGAFVQQNGTVQQLQSMIQSLQQEMQEMRSMFLQSMKQQNQQEQVASGGVGSGIGNEVGSHGDIDIGAKKNGDFDHVSQSNLRNVSPGDIRVNTKCKLLHWCDDELVVAEGRIASTDPNTKVHHVVLGRSCWKVWVDKVLVKNVDLIRPNDEMQFLEDAIGSTVAWLSKFIVLCD